MRNGRERKIEGLPGSLRLYIALVGVAGAATLATLAQAVEWGPTRLWETGLFTLLVVMAGCFPIPVGPRVRTDVTAAVLFGAALLLEPGQAALAGAVGIVAYTLVIRYWGVKLRLQWYKYPFNGATTALFVGAASAVFHALAEGDGLLTAAVIPAAVTYYMVNTALISGAAGLQLGLNPARFWWMGTKENGLAELSLYAFGFLGAVAYRESPWTIMALFIPVAVIYFAFSRLARVNAKLEEAVKQLEALQGRIVGTSKLASIGAISLDLSHQIKNPLAILLGRLEEVQNRLEEGSRAQRHLDIAKKEGWRIQELTQMFTIHWAAEVGAAGHM